MWSYYGSKSKVVKHYPKPLNNKIIEPFAGSARYSLKYFENEIFLYDKNEIITGIWTYLQRCSANDILKLPLLKQGDKIDRKDFDCIEQANLFGFILQNGVSSPMLTCSKWGEVVMKKQIKDIAANLFKIKHWHIQTKSYEEIENELACWFIDPPYQVGGNKYKFSNKLIDFEYLSGWCNERLGQVIVCESSAATWLPFVPLARNNGIRSTKTEMIYTNYHTHFNNVQQSLFPCH